MFRVIVAVWPFWLCVVVACGREIGPPTDADRQIAARVEEFSLSRGADPNGDDTLTIRVVQGGPLPPSLTEALLADLNLGCGGAERARCVAGRVSSYLHSATFRGDGLRPRTHRAFLLSLTDDEREAVVRVAAADPFSDSGGVAELLCPAGSHRLNCGEGLLVPPGTIDFDMDPSGRFWALTPSELLRHDDGAWRVMASGFSADGHSRIQVVAQHLYWSAGSELWSWADGQARTQASYPSTILGFFVWDPSNRVVVAGDTLHRVSGWETEAIALSNLALPRAPPPGNVKLYGLFPHPNDRHAKAILAFAFTDPTTHVFRPPQVFRYVLSRNDTKPQPAIPTLSGLGGPWHDLVMACGERHLLPVGAGIQAWGPRAIRALLESLLDPVSRGGVQTYVWSKADNGYSAYLPFRPRLDVLGPATCFDDQIYVLTGRQDIAMKVANGEASFDATVNDGVSIFLLGNGFRLRPRFESDR